MTRAQASCAGRSASLRAFTPVFDGLWTLFHLDFSFRAPPFLS